MEQGIEAHSFFQDNALRKSTAAQRSLGLLSLLVNQEDAPSLRVWLGLGDQDGRLAPTGVLRAAATGMGVDEIELLRRISDGEEKLNVPAMLRRHDELRGALEKLRQLQLPELIDELFPEGDLDSELLRDSAL